MTQKTNILAHLKSGRGITPLEALDEYGCFRLASVIGRLRNAGHDIVTQTVGGESYARYKMQEFVR